MAFLQRADLRDEWVLVAIGGASDIFMKKSDAEKLECELIEESVPLANIAVDRQRCPVPGVKFMDRYV